MAVGHRRHLLRAAFVLAALAAGLWAWTAGLTGPYQFDDYVTPLNDPASQSLAAWREYLPVTLRPATKLTYALEAEAGMNDAPAPRRAVSLTMLVASAVLLTLLAARLASPPVSTTLAPLLPAFIGLLWLAHPVHADAVLLVSGRTAVLAGMLLLGALLALELGRAWIAGALFLFACLARETALAGLLPLAVLAASRSAADWRSIVRELAPTLVAAGLALAWILSTPRYLALAEFSFLGRPFWSSVAAQVGAVPLGLSLLFQPSALSIDYGLPLPRQTTEPLALLGVALYFAATAGMLLTIKRARAVAVGLALCLAALLPTQSLIPKLDALSNRPLSMAFAGILLLVPYLLDRVSRGSPAGFRGAPGVALIIAGWLVLALTTHATANRAGLFDSELALWQDAAFKSRTSARPWLQYAQLLEDEGRMQEARGAVLIAHEIEPFSSDVDLFVRAFGSREVLE